MSHCADSERWDRFKNIIRYLHITKRHPLEGSDGVIKLMEDRCGFKATKAQYDRHIKKWGFRKNRTKEDWKIMRQKIELRNRTGKDSNVYLDRELVPVEKVRKEICRQGYMTSVEQFNQAQVSPPQTPPGFDIRTPSDQPLFRLIFEHLPILRFQEKMQTFSPFQQAIESVKPFHSELTALAPLLGKRHENSKIDLILPFLDSILPNTALLDEVRASGVAIERVDQLPAVEFLNLTTFLISNNLPGEANGERIYEWLKTYGSTPILDCLSSIKGPTAESVLENLFRLAVEAEDIPTVKYLLKVGVDLNGHACRHPKIPDTLTPLQFACIRGNTELAQELIKAGSRIDEDGSS